MKFRFLRKKCKTVEDWEEESKMLKNQTVIHMVLGLVCLVSFFITSEVVMGVMSGVLFGLSALTLGLHIIAKLKVMELKLKGMME